MTHETRQTQRLPGQVSPEPGLPKQDQHEADRLRWLLEAAPDAMAAVDATGAMLMVNGEFERLFGYAAGDLTGKPIEILVPDRFRERHPVHRARYALEPRTRPMGADLDLFALRQDGTEFPAEISLASLPTADGPQVIVAIRDVTERRRSEAQLRAFMESAPDAMVIADRSGRMVFVNAQTERVFGYTREELLGAAVEMLLPVRFRETHPQRRADYFASPKVRSMGSGLVLYGRRKDGTEFPIEVSLSPLASVGGDLVFSAIRDLTERRRADMLRFRLASIVDGSDDAMISESLDGLVTSWNAGAQALLGYTEEEMLGKPLTAILPEDGASEEARLLQQLQMGKRIKSMDTTRRHKDGRLIPVSMTMSPIRDSSGTLVGASKILRDITDRKEAEAATARAWRAAEEASREYEAFSYSIAHDLRAPLRSLDGFSQALLEDYGHLLDDVGRGYAGRIQGSARDMARLIDSLLTLARATQRELSSRQVDLSALATIAVATLRAANPERDVEVHIQPGMVARGDRALLASVLDNLLSNAWKFTRDTPDAKIEFTCDEQDGVRQYTVKDNGAGFDMAYSAKLFGVFQRLHTAQEFEGTGIGLATTQRIIRRHGGKIWARGEVGKGAAFSFTLTGQEVHG
jgi:PAS domain S-box-containing protein